MSEYIVPKRVYYTIFGVLLFCTYLTVQIAFFDLGRFNIVAALAIAAFKATLVVLLVERSRRSAWRVWRCARRKSRRACTSPRIRRQQGRLRETFLEIVQDGERLEERHVSQIGRAHV